MAIESCMAACAAITRAMMLQMGWVQAASRVKTVTPMMCNRTGTGWLSKKKPSAISAGLRGLSISICLADGQAVHHGLVPRGTHLVAGEGQRTRASQDGTSQPERHRKRSIIDH